jgi:hypothetical protein
MISSHRLKQAEQEGKQAALSTRLDPERVHVGYTKWSAQHKRFCKGWSYIFNRFPFLRSTKLIKS